VEIRTAMRRAESDPAAAHLPMMRVLSSTLIGLILLFALTSGCAINPVSKRPEIVLTTVEREREIGLEETRKLEKQVGFLQEDKLVRYVEAIGGRLAQHSPRQDVEYHFYVVDMVPPNAFALPGGYVFVTRGLLALVNSEDELASVIGHEIGHVAARHAVRRLSLGAPFAIASGLGAWATGIVSQRLGRVVGGIGNLAGGLLLAPYSREQEREADHLGQELAAAAGWDPGGMASFLHTLGREDALVRQGRPGGLRFFDSHPSTPERVEKTAKRARELETTPAASIAGGHTAFLGYLNGLRVGENPAEGQFVKGDFLHPGLKFSLRFPTGWKTHNAPAQVAAIAPDEEAFVMLEGAGEGNDPQEAARKFDEETRLRFSEEPARVSIGGLKAVRALGQYQGKSLDLTWIAHGGRIYQITGMSPASDFDAYRQAFLSTAQSFRPLTEAERASIRDTRLRLIRAANGESMKHLLDRAQGTWTPEEAAVANALAVENALRGGELVKVPIPEPYTE
jgi:predicted Zn-dependent protease